MSCLPVKPLNRTKPKYGTMKLKAYEKLYGWLRLVQYIFLTKWFYFSAPCKCTLSVP